MPKVFIDCIVEVSVGISMLTIEQQPVFSSCALSDDSYRDEELPGGYSPQLSQKLNDIHHHPICPLQERDHARGRR